MLLSMTAAFAATQGKITINPPSNAQATDSFTYNVYKVFDGFGDGTNISYKVKASKNSLLPDVAAQYDSFDGTTHPHFSVDAGGNVRFGTISAAGVFTAADELTAQAIAAIAAYVGSSDLVTTVSTTGTTAVQTSNLDNGYYFINTTTGTVVTIDSTNPDKTVDDKNSVPTIDKTITGVTDGTIADDAKSADVNIGDIIDFTVVVHAKKGAINYIFHDKLSAGLTLQAQSNLVIKVGDDELTAGEDYIVKYWNATTKATASDEDAEVGDNITIRFTNTYLATLTGDTDIAITYKVQLNDDAIIAGNGNPNTVDLEYGHNPTDTSNPEEPHNKTREDHATVFTYALALKKVKVNGDALADATFQLPFYVNATADTDGAYIYAGENPDDKTGLTNTLTTPASGEITIKGLEGGDYSFTETVAPDGYNKLEAPFTVTAYKTGCVTTEWKEYLDENGNVTERTENTTEVTYDPADTVPVGGFKVVVNKAGVELPSTGGIGTTLFYVGGGVLVLAAIILLVTKRRMNAND